MNTELSDLFFNLPHPRYDAACCVTDNTDDWREALRADAKEVLEMYPQTFDGLTADDLTEDFFKRL